MTAIHPAAPHHLPNFITAPDQSDILMIAVGIFLVAAVLMVGNIFLHLHTLPERMAHKSQKMQFEIVAILGLLALFTHVHLFWVAGLFLAIIDIPDFGTPLGRVAGALEKIADRPIGAPAVPQVASLPPAIAAPSKITEPVRASPDKNNELINA